MFQNPINFPFDCNVNVNGENKSEEQQRSITVFSTEPPPYHPNPSPPTVQEFHNNWDVNANGGEGTCNNVISSEEGSSGDKESRPHFDFGSSSGGTLAKENSLVPCTNNTRVNSSEQPQQGRMGHYNNAVMIAEPNMNFPQLSHAGTEKEPSRENNGCGFNGRKNIDLSSEPKESLSKIFSDPVTGTLMDDAMILPCGHSFGSGGMQHVTRMKACFICSHSVSEDLVRPNIALRSAVEAFRREEDWQSHQTSKKRKERFEQDVSSHGHSLSMDNSRGKGVQFPFVVTDRVIIKGNKRTPLRFVGREAVITTQCLNGWYVVKTLDNAESVKLQYRSLAKVSDSMSKSTPNWL